MDRKFWQGKRVLVTGHTGFKGSWLSMWLQRLGAHVCGFSLAPPTSANMFERAHVGQGLVDLRGDVRDAAAVRQALESQQPEILFHLAAQPLVRLSYSDPVSTYTTNVLGTVHMLEAARSTRSLRSIVIVTSDKCYENREWQWGYRENDLLGGHDPYSSSKACAEIVTSAYRRSFFSNPAEPVGIATVRAGNVIGGGDWAADRIVPDILRALQKGESIMVRNPSAIRPWQHVLEPLRGYMLVAQRLHEDPASWSEPWNFGPSEADARPVQELVELAISLWGEGSWHVPSDYRALHEARRLKLDCSQALARLGWQTQLNLEAALKLTVEWHRAEQAGLDMHDFTWRQIDEYQADAGRGKPLTLRPFSSSNLESDSCLPTLRIADHVAKAG